MSGLKGKCFVLGFSLLFGISVLASGDVQDGAIIEYVRKTAREDGQYWGTSCGTNVGNRIYRVDARGADLLKKVLVALQEAKFEDLSDASFEFSVVLETYDETVIYVLALDGSSGAVVSIYRLTLISLWDKDERAIARLIPQSIVNGHYDGFQANYEILKTSKELMDSSDDCLNQDWNIEDFNSRKDKSL